MKYSYLFTGILVLALVAGAVFLLMKKTEQPVIKEKEIVTEEIIRQKPIEKEVTEEILVEPIGVERTEIWKDVNEKIATGNPYRKQEAIEILVAMGDPESVKEIGKLTEDKTPSVVNRALNALGELKSEESIPLIDQVFEANQIRQDGYGESIRINAVNALGDIGSEKSVDMLSNELSKRNVSFGYYVVEALGKIGSAKSLPQLEEYKTFLNENLANMPQDEELGEYRYIWEQSAKQVDEAISKIKTKGAKAEDEQ